MITREDVVPSLLAACPSFGEPWQRYTEDATYDSELLYVHLGEFARHLVHLFSTDQTSEFPAIFAGVERLHVEGDPDVREATIIGLLEGLQNDAGHGGLDPQVFTHWLGPQSIDSWKKLNDFWSGKRPE